MDLTDMIDSRQGATPPVASITELADLHRQLLEAAPQRGPEYIEAAGVVRALTRVLEGFDGADPRTVCLVVLNVVLGLRRGHLRGLEGLRRFNQAEAWIDQLRIRKQIAQASNP